MFKYDVLPKNRGAQALRALDSSHEVCLRGIINKKISEFRNYLVLVVAMPSGIQRLSFSPLDGA